MFALHKTDRAEEAAAAAALQVAVMWGDDVLHVESSSPPRAFSVGEAQADFAIGAESLGTGRLEVVRLGEDGPELGIPEGARLEVCRDGRTYWLAQERSFRLTEGTRARLTYRGFTFAVALDPQVQRAQLGAGGAPALDRRAARCTVASLSVHLACLLLFQLSPPRSAALSLDHERAQSRLASYVIEQREAELTPELAGLADTQSEAGETKARSRDEEGQGGNVQPNPRRPKAATAPVVDPDAATPPESPASAASAGIIGLLRAASVPSDTPSAYTALSALSLDSSAALGMLLDAQGGALTGSGLAMIGTGQGSRGSADGTIGVGRLGTIGTCNGTGCSGRGAGYGVGAGRFNGRKTIAPPRITTDPPEIRGSLSKEAIRRVIHRNLNQIRYCYEQGLQTRPDLEGRIAVRFMIDASGLVKAAARESSSLGAPAVEHCITSTVQRWNFPAPDGGGLVVVTYPFVLQQSGQ